MSLMINKYMGEISLVWFKRDLAVKEFCKEHKIKWSEFKQHPVQRGKRAQAQIWDKQWIAHMKAPSNWGNWMYLAGVGFDPRGKRWFDPEKQASFYDPNGQFRELWLSSSL